MSSSGPNFAGAAADDATIGAVAWSSTSEAVGAPDGTGATAALTSNASHYLSVSSFGFSIPATATISGIVVEFYVRRSGLPTHTISDNSVKIVKGGVISGDEKGNGTDWNQTGNYKSYGSASDLWGLTWVAGDINNSNFGAVISGINDGVPSSTGTVEACRITVYYTDSSFSDVSFQGGMIYV